LGATPDLAQGSREIPTTRLLLHCFVADGHDPILVECEGVYRLALGIVTHPAEYSRETIRAVPDGMDSLLVGHPNPRIRFRASTALVTAGHYATAPDILDRFRKAYDASDDKRVRENLVRWALSLADTATALWFFEHAARDSRRAEGLAFSIQGKRCPYCWFGEPWRYALARLSPERGCDRRAGASHAGKLGANDFSAPD
jgi:hypothetical protein